MVDMNSDQILEVPDTPDRIRQLKCPVSSSIVRRDIAMEAGTRRPRIKRTGTNFFSGSLSQDNACGVLMHPSDTEDIFRQAEAARVLALSEDLEAKLLPSQKSDKTTGKFVEKEKGTEKHSLDHSSNISSHLSCSVSGGRTPSCQVRDVEVTQQDVHYRNANFLGVGSGLPTVPVGKPRNKTCTSTTNRLKLVADAESCSTEVNAIAKPSSLPFIVPQRHVGQKKLVRNGCISPSNIAKRSVKVDGKRDMCSLNEDSHHDRDNVIDLTDNSPIMTRQRYGNMDTRVAKKLRTDRAGKTSIPQSEYHANSSNCSKVSLSVCNNKGKEIICDISGTDQIREANMRSISSSTAGASSVLNEEQGWRTTHNRKSNKLPIPLMGKEISISGREYGSSRQSNQAHGSVGEANNSSFSVATIMAPDSLGNKTIMTGSGRRKHLSTSFHPGISASALDEPGGMPFASSRTTAGRIHINHQDDIPVITLDDIPSEARPSSSGYTNETSVDPTIQAQLESDELLARQLQEQLYNESSRVSPTEEIDAIIARSLQHEDDANRASRAARRLQNNTRGVRLYRANSYRNALRARLANSSANDMMFSGRNTAPLGLGAAFARYTGAAHIQPNIDLNDYDALLALDENNHQHTGASESQINNLPQSTVQAQSNCIEEPCAVCLENPSVGDTIRHLPCFHKFHKECIDEWLRRKKLCPICKSGIR